MRIERLWNTVKHSAQAVLVTARHNVFYLSGFTGSNGCILLTNNTAALFTDGRYVTQAKTECCIDVIGCEENCIKTACKKALSAGVKHLAFEDLEVSLKEYNQLSDFITVPIGDKLDIMRQVKDETELKRIRHAAQLADRAFEFAVKTIKPGVTELEIALTLEGFMRTNGASGVAFDTIVVSGERGALPHGKPTSRQVNAGELVTMDFGCIVDGYCSDITRTVTVGKPKPELLDLANIVYYTQLRCIDQLKVHGLCSVMDEYAHTVFNNFKMDKYYAHGLGHGVGVLIHELPRLSKKSADKLLPNSVVTIEPGLYIPGLGGVRIEDMVLIGEAGVQVITHAPKELIW